VKRLSMALALGVLAACNQQNPSTQTGQTEPESIIVYSGRSEELVGPILKSFEQKTGVELDIKYGDTAELASTILEEGDRSPADLFLAQDAGALGAVQKEGRFISLPQGVLGKVSAQFRSGSGNWVGVTGRARVVVYNTDKLRESDLPASILDYTDPKWKDKVGWAPTNGSFQSFVTALRKVKGEGVAKSWLEGIKANGAKTYERNSAIVKAVGVGEIEVGFVNHYYLIQIKSEDPGIKAANYYFQGGDLGGLVNVSGAGILKSSKNREGALVLLEYLLSTEAQEAFASAEFEYPIIDGVSAARELPLLNALEQPVVDLSDLDDLRGTLELLKQVGLV
jgi:iron(III) transport system substrate-binding protein